MRFGQTYNCIQWQGGLIAYHESLNTVTVLPVKQASRPYQLIASLYKHITNITDTTSPRYTVIYAHKVQRLNSYLQHQAALLLVITVGQSTSLYQQVATTTSALSCLQCSNPASLYSLARLAHTQHCFITLNGLHYSTRLLGLVLTCNDNYL